MAAATPMVPHPNTTACAFFWHAPPGRAAAHCEGFDQTGGAVADHIRYGIQGAARFCFRYQDILREAADGPRTAGVSLGEPGIGIDPLSHPELRHLRAHSRYTGDCFVSELAARGDAVAGARPSAEYGGIRSADAGTDIPDENIPGAGLGNGDLAECDLLFPR